MRTTLDIDPSVLEVARAIAVASRRSIGAVVSDFALRGIKARDTLPTAEGRHPVFAVPADARPIDPAAIRLLIEEDGLSD